MSDCLPRKVHVPQFLTFEREAWGQKVFMWCVLVSFP